MHKPLENRVHHQLHRDIHACIINLTDKATHTGVLSKKWCSQVEMWYLTFGAKCESEWRYFRVVLWIATTMSFVRGSWRLLRGGKYLHEEAMEIEFGA